MSSPTRSSWPVSKDGTASPEEVARAHDAESALEGDVYGIREKAGLNLAGIAPPSDGLTPGREDGIQGREAMAADFRQVGGGPGSQVLHQDSTTVENPCGKLLEKSDTVELKTPSGATVKVVVERYERCVRVTYLGTGVDGAPDTVIELPAGKGGTVEVGAHKVNATSYSTIQRAQFIGSDKDGAIDWDGHWCSFAVDCAKAKFVQFKRRTAKWNTDTNATVGAWELDVPAGKPQDPAAPFGGTLPKPKAGGDGQTSQFDAPGGAGGLPDKNVPDGTTFAITDDLETFVCCDGALIGYWSWSVTRTYKYKNKICLTPSTVTGNEPAWHDAAGASPNWAVVKCH